MALVEAMVPALVPAVRRTPYAIYGHSMGAWVAFELVRALRRLRRPLPVHLFIGARRPPHLPGTFPPMGDLPRDAFIAEVQRRYDAIPQALLANPGVLDLFLPALRADFRMLETYRYRDEPPLDVPITVFYGEHDQVVARGGRLRQWQEHTTQPLQLHPVPGGHFFLNDHADLVTARIAGALR
jgi:surfactin synthase thioesterase subunit